MKDFSERKQILEDKLEKIFNKKENEPQVLCVNMIPELKTTKNEKLRLELIYHLNDYIKGGNFDFVKHFGMNKEDLFSKILENVSEEELIEIAYCNDKIVEHYSNLSKQKVLNKVFTSLHP